MKRNSAQAGESKLESRFAALTSGLLARKGQAAPSNSPIHDPAEETDAFALEPTNSASKKKAAELASAAARSRSAAPSAKAPPKGAARDEAAKNPPAVTAKVETPKPAANPAPAANAKPPAPAKAAPAAAAKAAAPITIINERSEAAGYPDNPSPEEIAALEAEADEVVSYFENFGNDDAVALEKDNFYGVEDDDIEDEDEGDDDDFDDLNDLNNSELQESDADGDNDAPPGAPPSVAISGPWAGASVPPVSANSATTVRAGVTVQLTAREFMRLSLGAAELDQSAQELIVEAIEEYLDARGVLSLGGCSCLEALTKKPGDA